MSDTLSNPVLAYVSNDQSLKESQDKIAMLLQEQDALQPHSHLILKDNLQLRLLIQERFILDLHVPRKVNASFRPEEDLRVKDYKDEGLRVFEHFGEESFVF